VPALLQRGAGLRPRAEHGGLHGADPAVGGQPAGGHRQDPDLPRALRRLPAPAVPGGPRRPAAEDRPEPARPARRGGRAGAPQGDRGAAGPGNSGGAEPRQPDPGQVRRRGPAPAAAEREPRRQRHRRVPLPGLRRPVPGRVPGAVMTGQSQRANDAWEALLTAHATLMKQFAAEDIWADVSMREYDVLYT